MAEEKLFKLFVCVSILILPTQAFIEGIYCGKENCYDVLDVTRESTKGEISKAYRKLARKWHPDMHKTKKAKEEATVMFQKIATAYEILTDEEQRKDYDYMLDNPDEYYAHYFYYYRRRMAPKVDVRIVIAVSITVISIVQYYTQYSNYHAAIDYLLREPKYRLRATDIAKKEGLLETDKKKLKKKTKEEIREEGEAVLRKVLVEKMDIKGGHSPPSVYNILWVQLVLSPYYLGQYLIWWATWVYRFNIKKEEYGEEEKLYLIKKYMKRYANTSNAQWEAIDEPQKEDFLDQELWIYENFTEWKRVKDEEMKAKLAESARYKSYRRYMKNNGPGQMTFGPE